MTIGECIRDYVFSLGEKLGLPVAFEGEAFIAPAGPYLRCAIGRLTARAAAIGRGAPTRVDGSLALTLEALAGGGMDELSCLAARVAACFPYGFGLDCRSPQGEGEIIFAAPKTGQPQNDGGRLKLEISLGFYAILFREGE